MKHSRLHALVCALMVAFAVLIPAVALGQTSIQKTPYVGFELPPYGVQNWETYWFTNFTIADNFFGGASPFTHGILLDTTAAQPTCTAQTRGLVWTLLGSTDMLEQCIQVGGSSYAWTVAAVGAHWYVGSGAPTDYYNNGDFYLDITAGNLYEQLSGSWVLEGSIRGTAGVGVPTGGAAGYVLTKNSSTNYDDLWLPPAGGTWGTITGTLSSQTDLEAALNAKQNSLGFTPENVANKDADNGYAGLDSSGLLKTVEAPTWNQSTTGTAAGLSAPITESQVTNLTSDLASKLASSTYNPDWNAVSGPQEILNKPTIPAASTSNPAMDGTASPGTSTSYARADHVHPTDTSREAIANKGVANGYAPLNSSTEVPLANIPAIPESQVTNLPTDLASKLASSSYNPDWNATTGPQQILNKPTLGTAAALGKSGNGTEAATTNGLSGTAGAQVCQDGSGNLTGSGCPDTSAGVSSFNGRVGIVVPANGDYTASQVTGAEQTANKDQDNGYAGLTAGGLLKVAEAPTWNQSTTGTAAGLSAPIAESQVTNLTSDLASKLASSTYNPDWNATTGPQNILNKPSIPAGQVNSDWNATSGVAQILNKPSIPQGSTVVPQMDSGTGSIGSSSQYALADHVHPTDTSRAADAAVVHNTGNESVNGTKTFSNSPSIPDPMNPNDAADKNYVDQHAGLPDVTDQQGVQVTIGVPTQIGTGPLQISGLQQSGTTVTVPTGQQFSIFVGSDSLLHCQLSSGSSCGAGGGGGGGAVWGSITGTLSNQTDLQTALNAKGGIGLCSTVGTFATQLTAGGLNCSMVQWAQIANEPSFATVATSGSYNDLLNLPALPSPSSTIPLVDSGSGSTGSSSSYARADHVHPTDTTRAADSAVVHNVNNETVNGTKTFVSSPIVPDPTSGTQAANMEYVLAHAGGGGGGGGASGPNYATSFVAQTSITILGTSHQLQTKNLIVSCYDNASPANSIQPASYTVNAASYNVIVNFATAQTGYCVVNGSGPGVYQTTESSSNSWSITAATHGLGKYVQVKTYDSNGYEIAPGAVLIDSSGDVTISFAMAQSGSVVISQ